MSYSSSQRCTPRLRTVLWLRSLNAATDKAFYYEQTLCAGHAARMVAVPAMDIHPASGNAYLMHM